MQISRGIEQSANYYYERQEKQIVVYKRNQEHQKRSYNPANVQSLHSSVIVSKVRSEEKAHYCSDVYALFTHYSQVFPITVKLEISR